MRTVDACEERFGRSRDEAYVVKAYWFRMMKNVVVIGDLPPSVKGPAGNKGRNFYCNLVDTYDNSELFPLCTAVAQEFDEG